MFNNKFLKNDPLLEAVKAAQAEGAMRREAEKIVNEEFGVYSRKAVVREQLAAYDAALDEVYTALKEGKKIDQDGDRDNDFADVMIARMKKGGKSHDDAVASTRGKSYNKEEIDYSAQDRAPVTKSPKGYEDPSTPKVPYSELPKTQNRAGAVIDSAKGALKESIVTKIRAKHMKEGSSFNSAQVTGKSVREQAAPSLDFGVTRDGATPKSSAPKFNMGNIKPDAAMKIQGGVKKAPGMLARGLGTLGAVAAIPAAAATGATAAQMLGAAATGTKTGRDIGKSIGDNVPGAKAAANALKPVQNYLRDKLGINQPKTTTPAASTPPAAKSTTTQTAAKSTTTPAAGTAKPAPAPKPAAAPAAAPASAPAKSSFYKGGSQGDYTIKRGDTLSGIAKRTGQSVSDLAKMNKISDVNKISSGAKLMTKVPTPPSRPADISKPAEPAASKPYKPVSPDTDIDKKIKAGGVTIGTVKTPTAADDPDATGYTSREYGSKVSRDFNDVRPQSSPQSSSPAPEPAKPAAPAPEPKKKEAGAAPAAPMAESVVTVGANKYRIV